MTTTALRIRTQVVVKNIDVSNLESSLPNWNLLRNTVTNSTLTSAPGRLSKLLSTRWAAPSPIYYVLNF